MVTIEYDNKPEIMPSKRVNTLEQERKQKQALKKEAYRRFVKKPIKTVQRLATNTKGFQKGFKAVSKSVKFKPKLSKSLLSYANAFGGGSSSASGQKYATAGRPKGSLKWRSPFTGKPIPATVYYKEVRQFRRLQEQKAEQSQAQQLQQLARKGVPPSQVPLIQERMRQQALLEQTRQQVPRVQSQIQPQQQANQNQLPNGTVIPMGNRIWKFERGVVGQEGGLFGPVKKVYGAESSFWN